MRIKRKIILPSLAIVTASVLGVAAVSAESVTVEQSMSFTFNPTVSIAFSDSSDLAIGSLTPGDYKDSNSITVTASSNGVAGYTLSGTVGSSTNASTELRESGTSKTNIFSSLTANAASLSEFSDSDNTWGYSYSTDSGSTWISGDITGTTATGYNGLPVYTTSSPVYFISASAPGSSSIQFKIGARATTSQIAGTYTNVINFIGVGKVVTTTYTISFSDESGEASSMPSTQSGSTDSGAVQINSTQPSRSGYMFKGWCTASTSGGSSCSGTTVYPNGFLALNPGTSSTTATVTQTLYAMWESTSSTSD